jgi:MOSC domain-containing protein YiiM
MDKPDQQPGKLVKIWVKRAHRGPMDKRESGMLVAGAGLEGSADQGGRRQVTLIAAERWKQMMAELHADLDPSARRANLLVEGIDLGDSRGKLLAVGPCILRILGETRPCERMEEALPGLRASMSAPWNGGAYGEILTGGSISLGDEVRWVS